MTETSDVVRPTIETLNGIPGVVAYRIHGGKVKVRGGWMHLGETGIADIGVCVRGHAIFLEAKAPKGLVSEEQLRWHGRARRAGGTVVVIRSVADAVSAVRQVLDEQDASNGIGVPLEARTPNDRTGTKGRSECSMRTR